MEKNIFGWDTSNPPLLSIDTLKEVFGSDFEKAIHIHIHTHTHTHTHIHIHIHIHIHTRTHTSTSGRFQ